MASAKIKCKRCGQCCKRMWIPFTPDQLKTGFLNWRDKRGGWEPYEIWLLYPMLRVIRRQGNGAYYRCVHYSESGGVGKCGIYSIRPAMCRDYPLYNTARDVRIGEKTSRVSGLHPGCAYRGCGGA